MELVLSGWICRDWDGELGISYKRRSENTSDVRSFSDLIADKFGCEIFDDIGLGVRQTIIQNANLRCWFSDKECTLEEAQKSFESYLYTGNLLTSGHYIGYSEWTITGFDLDSFVLGGHDLKKELENHLGQYVHFILMDELEES